MWISHFRSTCHDAVIQFWALFSYRATICFGSKTFIAETVYALCLSPKFWQFVFMREIGASHFSLFFLILFFLIYLNLLLWYFARISILIFDFQQNFDQYQCARIFTFILCLSFFSFVRAAILGLILSEFVFSNVRKFHQRCAFFSFPDIAFALWTVLSVFGLRASLHPSCPIGRCFPVPLPPFRKVIRRCYHCAFVALKGFHNNSHPRVFVFFFQFISNY